MGPKECGKCEENPLQDWPEHLGWRSVRSLLRSICIYQLRLYGLDGCTEWKLGSKFMTP